MGFVIFAEDAFMPPKLAGWIVLFAMMLAIVGAGAWLGVTSVTGLLTVSRSHVWDSAAQPHVQEIRGPHSISLLAHAKAGAEAARPVFEFLQSLGDTHAESPAPLTDNEIATLAGTYVFGIGVNQQSS
jgi:hypothetical protein